MFRTMRSFASLAVCMGGGWGYCICEIPFMYFDMCFCSLAAVGKSEDNAATLENRGRVHGRTLLTNITELVPLYNPHIFIKTTVLSVNVNLPQGERQSAILLLSKRG